MNTKIIQRLLPSSLYSFLRSTYWSLRSLVALPYGFIQFSLTDKTPEVAYQSMIWLFCITRGKFNDWVSSVASLWSPPTILYDQIGVLGDMSDSDQLDKVVKELQQKGFVVFPSALAVDVIDRLHAFTAMTPASVRRMDGQNTAFHIGKRIYTGRNPNAVRYDYDAADLLNHEDVQALLADGSLLSVVQKYLGCNPIADVLGMWWHTNCGDKADSEAAQFYHFDMDRIKWVKIFIYLTDVNENNGPHSFVEGSHQSGAIPASILKRGYARISDEEINNLYPPKLIHSFTAPRGTIIIEDTRGLHKGAHVFGGSRLILQLQFSNSLFGTNYPKSKITTIKSKNLLNIIKTTPKIYRQYL